MVGGMQLLPPNPGTWIAVPDHDTPGTVRCLPWGEVAQQIRGDALPLMVYRLEVGEVPLVDGGGFRAYALALGEFSVTGEGDTIEEAISGFTESYASVTGLWRESGAFVPPPDYYIHRLETPPSVSGVTWGAYTFSYAWNRAELGLSG